MLECWVIYKHSGRLKDWLTIQHPWTRHCRFSHALSGAVFRGIYRIWIIQTLWAQDMPQDAFLSLTTVGDKNSMPLAILAKDNLN